MGSTRRQNLTPYEVHLFRSLPYWLFWPAMGAIAFIGSELIEYAFADKHFTITQLVFSVGLAFGPVIVVWLSQSFRLTMVGLASLLWSDDTEFNHWVAAKEEFIFTFKSRQAKLVVSTVVLVGVVTVMSLGLPLRNPAANVLGLTGFTIVLAMGGHSAFVFFELLVTLTKLAQRDVRAPFFRLPHPALNRLQSYYSLSAILTTCAYVLLVIAVWQGPYGLSAIMLIWLTILSIYPLSTFIWSTIQVHRLAQKAKQAHLDVVNGLVQANLREISEHNTIDAYQKLEKAMGIQVQVQKTQEWPLNIPDTITFLITVMTAVVQTTISLTTAFKP